MHDERARVLIAEQYERARTVVGKFLVDSGYDKLAGEPKLEPRDMAIVIEALGTGLAMQAALDPQRVRLALEAEVMAKLLQQPVPPVSGAAMPPVKPDPSGSAAD
jgi:hypothetical protein